MPGSGGQIRLPRVIAATSGHGDEPARGGPGGPAVLLRNTDLAALIDFATVTDRRLVVDLDTVKGLGADDAAVEFVRSRLSIDICMTRRPPLARRFAALGGLALLNVLAFDSTGLRRSLQGHPRTSGVGTVISPGIVLRHMLPSELALLVRPLAAYGLISTGLEAEACLQFADAVVVSPGVARQIRAP